MSMPHYGDHISVDRGLYSHHGIYVGKGKVVHYDNDLGILGKITGIDEPEVRKTSLKEFLDGSDEYRVHLYDRKGNETRTLKKRYSD
ncbi:MAG: lecithin retinol acyltransferase family protein [Selenomonadaceae bacterium]|nr:lecithin retinol acyltransferase family protein [Selenomonadaceae bacterium]